MVIVYRLCPSQYADDLMGKGAAIYGGRWNSKGLPALYVSQTVSLAILEVLVHIQQLPMRPYTLLQIQIADSLIAPLDRLIGLPARLGLSTQHHTQAVGDAFLREYTSLALQVPSILHDYENNLVINPRHSSFSDLRVVESAPFVFDPRLFL